MLAKDIQTRTIDAVDFSPVLESRSSNALQPLGPSASTESVSPGFRVLILKADRLYSEMLRTVVQPMIVGASIVLAASLAEASRSFAQESVDLLVTGVAVRDGDVLGKLSDWLDQKQVVRDAFVVTDRIEPYTLYTMTKLRLLGVFDQRSEGLADFGRAVALVRSGQSYWSPSVIKGITKHCLSPTSICRCLTETEKRVFTVIGDGCDDNVAAARTGLKSTTIATVRRTLHRKLGVRHKGELLRAAVLLGFVRGVSIETAAAYGENYLDL